MRTLQQASVTKAAKPDPSAPAASPVTPDLLKRDSSQPFRLPFRDGQDHQGVEHRCGESLLPVDATRPEEYLPALTTVLQRPWELTRKDLRELRLALDQQGISETTLAAAVQAVWRRAGWPAAQLQGADLAGIMPPRFVPTPDGGTMTV